MERTVSFEKLVTACENTRCHDMKDRKLGTIRLAFAVRNIFIVCLTTLSVTLATMRRSEGKLS
jgi:hypothetical protein